MRDGNKSRGETHVSPPDRRTKLAGRDRGKGPLSLSEELTSCKEA